MDIITAHLIPAPLGEVRPWPELAEALATWDPSKSDIFFDSSSGEGTVTITLGCVWLMKNTKVGEKFILLVWPEPTIWNASSQAIEFVDVLGGHQELRDGDKIKAGGAGYPGAHSPEYMGNPNFVIPPDPSCNADELFVLNSIRAIQD